VSDLTWLVVNRASGSNSDNSVRDVRAGLAAAGAQPERIISLNGNFTPAQPELVEGHALP